MLSDLLAVVGSADFLIACIRMTTPLLLAAMGGIYSEKTGVLNISLEGMMLVGAFTGYYISYSSGSAAAGIIAAIIIGALMGLFHALMTVTLRCDQVVTAVGINVFALGVTSSLFRTLFGVTTSQLESPGLEPIAIPILSKIPVIGSVFFEHIWLVYLAFLMVPVTHYIMFYTNWGLNIRSVGEHPRAADTLGVNVYAVRYICVTFSGIMAALGGASLSIGGLNSFLDNMTAGRGFIAFAAIIFGKFNPIGTFLACLLFGTADAFQLRLQAMGSPLPHHLFLMLPYLVTLLTLIFFVGPSIAPRSQGVPYVRDER